jgi:hypothetical protein
MQASGAKITGWTKSGFVIVPNKCHPVINVAEKCHEEPFYPRKKKFY